MFHRFKIVKNLWRKLVHSLVAIFLVQFIFCTTLIVFYTKTRDEVSFIAKVHSKSNVATETHGVKLEGDGRFDSGQNHKQETRNIFYLKIHKTGSTTFHNILCRFGLRRNLKIAVYNSLYGAPFPQPCKPELLFEKINKTNFQPYNLVCDHSVYNDTYPFEYMAENTVSIALIRDPFTRLKSAFRYFSIDRYLKLHGYKYPLYEFLKEINDSSHSWDIPRFTQNTQMYTFGWQNVSNNNTQKIREYISYIDSHFSLVLTLERFDESLVLLKRQFNWKMEDILHRINNVHHKAEIPPEVDKQRMMIETNNQLSKADFMLYDYFSSKLDKLLASQSDDFQMEVEYFKSINSNVNYECQKVYKKFKRKLWRLHRREIFRILNLEVASFPATKWHTKFNVLLKDCRLMALDTLLYHNAIRVRQFPVTCDPTSGPPFVRDAMYRNHDLGPEWCANDTDSIYNFALDFFVGSVLPRATKRYSLNDFN